MRLKKRITDGLLDLYNSLGNWDYPDFVKPHHKKIYQEGIKDALERALKIAQNS